MKILITGGAGFVGSSLAVTLKRDLPEALVYAFDNLRRRGSELIIARLRSAGVEFVHGDVRMQDDLAEVGDFDLLIECSAEPSVHAGYGGSPSYLIQTNLMGTVNCLEAARIYDAAVVFLSTSRVYPIDGLRALPLERRGDRLVIAAGAAGVGWSSKGITKEFPLTGRRSMYGATKLASELLIEEYRTMYGLRIVVNRCGVIAGPWQMGKVDQGFVVLWAARHLFGGALSYTGFGGEGLQVRDLLHVDDLYDLVRLQMDQLPRYDGAVLNVGGGNVGSVSLLELTGLCRERSGLELTIPGRPETAPADIPYYVTDVSPVTEAFGWKPRRTVNVLMDDIYSWLRGHRAIIEPILGAS